MLLPNAPDARASGGDGLPARLRHHGGHTRAHPSTGHGRQPAAVHLADSAGDRLAASGAPSGMTGREPVSAPLAPLSQIVAGAAEDQEPAPGFRAQLDGVEYVVTAVLERTAVLEVLATAGRTSGRRGWRTCSWTRPRSPGSRSRRGPGPRPGGAGAGRRPTPRRSGWPPTSGRGRTRDRKSVVQGKSVERGRSR